MPDASKITVAGYKEALSILERDDKISENQMTWLKAHYNAPDQVITATELAEMVGFKGHHGVNLWYGKLGKLVAEIVGYRRPSQGYTFLSTFVTFEREATPFPMKLRPNFAKALQELRWV